MPSDLEKFLQQAAERLAEKVKQATNPDAPPPRPPQTVRAAERRRPVLEAEILDAEIIEAELIDSKRREAGPNPLSNLDTRPGLAQDIGLADERMAEHLHDIFDRGVAPLPRSKIGHVQGETEKSIDLQRRSQQVSPLIEMLRQPSTLRAAFIASEVFARKF